MSPADVDFDADGYGDAASYRIGGPDLHPAGDRQPDQKAAADIYHYPLRRDRDAGANLYTGGRYCDASAAEDEEHLRLMRQVGIKSYMVVPLIAREHPLGAISFFRRVEPALYAGGPGLRREPRQPNGDRHRQCSAV